MIISRNIPNGTNNSPSGLFTFPFNVLVAISQANGMNLKDRNPSREFKIQKTQIFILFTYLLLLP